MDKRGAYGSEQILFCQWILRRYNDVFSRQLLAIKKADQLVARASSKWTKKNLTLPKEKKSKNRLNILSSKAHTTQD